MHERTGTLLTRVPVALWLGQSLCSGAVAPWRDERFRSFGVPTAYGYFVGLSSVTTTMTLEPSWPQIVVTLAPQGPASRDRKSLLVTPFDSTGQHQKR